MVLAILLTATLSCSNDDDTTPPSLEIPNLVEAAQDAGLTTLLDAVGAVDGLDQTLLDAQAITVFAPTNDAFADALTAFGANDLNELVEAIGGVDNLQTVLGFHVVPAVAFSTDLAEGEQTFNTLAGQEITVTKTGSSVTVTDWAGTVRNVVTADVEIENGVVHVIDGVLLPELPEQLPNLVEAAQGAGLTTLLDAVGAVDGLDQTLLDAEAITVFAPTNDAFADALTAFDVTNLTELVDAIGGVDNLETILGFHVVPAVAFSTDLAEGEQTFTTLAEQDITVTKTGDAVTVTDWAGTVRNVVTADVEIENGVVHVIDGVLLPELPPAYTFNIIADSPNHTVLEQLLIDSELDQVLKSGTFTVFAPTDDAFDNIDTSGLTAEQVTNILLNHVITGNVLSTDLTNGYIKTNAVENYSGDDNFIDMYVNIDSGVTLNDNATVSTADLESSNGTVHVVDEVITIPNIVDLAAANPMFSNLATALTQENLLGTLSTDAGTSPAPFTVFAPNNDAFQNFLDEDPNDAFGTIQDVLDLANLSDVLTYHVLPDGGVRADDITDGITPTTVQGETITINTTSGVTITDQNARTTNIIATDVTGSNGVIHVLDNVILPTL